MTESDDCKLFWFTAARTICGGTEEAHMLTCPSALWCRNLSVVFACSYSLYARACPRGKAPGLGLEAVRRFTCLPIVRKCMR